MGIFGRSRRHATKLDADAQPSGGFNASRRLDRDISEMLGLVKGVLADGVVTVGEAELLRDWAKAHPDVVRDWPGRILHERLKSIFADGRIDDIERADLADLLRDIVGGSAGVILGASAATQLPLDKPPPRIRFEEATFVFTGRFAFGSRKACESEVVRLGGLCASNVTFRTNYLVIGTFGSRDWIQSSHGRKIEKAIEYRGDQRSRIAIVGEDHWAEAL